jgi:hypothetical protein
MRKLVSRAAAHESARGRVLSLMTTAHFSATAAAQENREKTRTTAGGAFGAPRTYVSDACAMLLA